MLPSVINCHISYLLPLLFYMNGTDAQELSTRSALDALVIVNYKRFFDSSADRSHRTVSCRLGTSLQRSGLIMYLLSAVQV